MELVTFSIPSFRKEDIQKRLDKLVRKAVKYGNGDITYSFGKSHLVNRETEFGLREYEFIDITVSGDAPQIAGWQLLARVELLEGDENLVHQVPGVEASLDENFRTHSGHCDHCNTARRRNDVYVLTDGLEQIAVGRTCLRDFLGIDDPKSIVSRAQFFEELRDFEEEDMLGSFGSFGYRDLKTILVTAAAFIRKKGYVSKAGQAETGYETTGQSVTFALSGIPGYDIEVSAVDRELADKTVEFFRSAARFDNDYMNNLRILLSQDIVKKQHIALVSSAVITAQRQLAPKTKVQESNFVGEVKERLKDLELLLDRVIFLGSGAFGPAYLHLMKDKTGNVFSWITGNKIEMAEGSVVKLDASVKQHKLYNDTKQTVLTRAKVKE